jgi:hypothetical protein
MATQNERGTVETATADKPAKEPSVALEWIKAAGMPLVTLVVTLLGGFYFTNLTRERETRNSNQTLYATLITQREQSDAQIRKDMFAVVFKEFLSDPKQQSSAKGVLQLELLANNFSQSIDLAPLFKELARQLDRGGEKDRAANNELRKRLDEAAANLIYKQVDSLSQRGYSIQETINLGDWVAYYGKPRLQGTFSKSRLTLGEAARPATAGASAPIPADDAVQIKLELIDVNLARRELEVRLRINFPDDTPAIDRHFWVGQYDFPMLDNLQLPHGLRASVVITQFLVNDAAEKPEDGSVVDMWLVVFPASSASLKERQDYEDILRDMLRTRK